MAEPITIVPSVLRQQVEEGMKLKPLAEHYGLPVTQMKKALQAQNLQIRRLHHAPKFVFAEEVVDPDPSFDGPQSDYSATEEESLPTEEGISENVETSDDIIPSPVAPETPVLTTELLVEDATEQTREEAVETQRNADHAAIQPDTDW